jgi:NhaP-type Na+/H+ or K+/H+ antiporter
MSLTIMFIGLAVFLAHFLALQFGRTQIPDVLVLMLLGIVLGPMLGLVQPSDFGKAGSALATIALVVILFESGTSLDLGTLRASARTTGVLTVLCFLLTVALISTAAALALGLPLVPALILGATLGGTSSAVVIPLVGSLQMGVKPATVLVLESALTDVLCIIAVFALLQVALQGDVDAGRLVGSVLSAMVFAAVIGVVGGAGWMLVLGRIRGFPNTITATLAYVFIVYGLTEFLGFSGAIAALSLGITLGNVQRLGLEHLGDGARKVEPLSPEDINFYREAVFLLKTFFFIYLGISIQFGAAMLALVALVMVLAVYAMRALLVRGVCRGPDYSLRDQSITAIMAPKGLAAAVLATLPLQNGVEGGEIIRDVSYMVVLISISLTALLVVALPRPPVQRLMQRLLGATPLPTPAPAAGPIDPTGPDEPPRER